MTTAHRPTLLEQVIGQTQQSHPPGSEGYSAAPRGIARPATAAPTHRRRYLSGMSSAPRGSASTVILLVAGMLFVALAATAMLTDRNVLAGGFGVLGLLGFVFAALAPRMQGGVKAGLQGFEFELVREIVEIGERTGSADDVIVAAIRKAIQTEPESPVPAGTEPSPRPSPSPGGRGPDEERPVFRSGPEPRQQRSLRDKLAGELFDQAARTLRK